MWRLCLLLCGLCLLLCGGCVCYCVGLCLLLWVGCVCYCVGLCLLLWVVVFVIVIFVWFKFSNVVWDKVGEVRGWSFIRCYLCQFDIGALDKGLIDFLISHSVCLSFWCVNIVFEVH